MMNDDQRVFRSCGNTSRTSVSDMNNPAVEYERVSFTYSGSPVAALENVSLRVEVGERLGILGPNGAGKSTLLKLTLGLLPMQKGRISVMGRSPIEARRAGLVGYLPQRLEAELRFPLTVRQVVMLGAAWRTRAWAAVPAAAREAAENALDVTGALEFADRPIGRLSGGQVQRAMIARALAARPRILVLDEPTVGIDAAGQRQFADLLQRVHRDTGLTLIIVSHNLRAIAAGCDRVACLARRLHSHVTPEGLTPQVLGELFSHDVEGLWGELHVDAHTAAACKHDHGHEHEHGHAQAPVAGADQRGKA
jgi:zinc transport system ATP-binding protein